MRSTASSGIRSCPGPGEILHKISFVFETPVVKIGVFFFSLQFQLKKIAQTSCILRLILIQYASPKSF